MSADPARWLGRRVVVRHRLPDGLLSDALGDLVAVGDSDLTVRTRAGDVTVARTDVVAAKPVPPRPSRTARRTWRCRSPTSST